tara:strand:+ start:1127 stop:1297 length:171 start_codon:yes stop_codon:yes gene_type:complete
MQNGFPLEIIIRPASLPAMVSHPKKEHADDDDPDTKKKKAKAARALSKLFTKKGKE